MKCSRGYGATAARLTPDQKVGSSNLSALMIILQEGTQKRTLRSQILVLKTKKAGGGAWQRNHKPSWMLLGYWQLGPFSWKVARIAVKET